jgi:hypothetical protein
MPARRTQGSSADQFPTAPAKKALPDAEPIAAQTEATAERASPHYLLPKDLPGALKHLHDDELDTLLEATIGELKRRDRLPSRLMKEAPPRRPLSQQRPAGDDSGALTKGQLNAVRAAFKAGVKPAAIARQFGISQADVRKALASGVRDIKPDR